MKPTIEQTAWVFENLKEYLHSNETYREFIYGRLGYETDAYIMLLDGLKIANEFSDLKENMNTCLKHQQLYTDYCMYCGDPKEKKVSNANTANSAKSEKVSAKKD